jgi:S1-C subfamily serine protease
MLGLLSACHHSTPPPAPAKPISLEDSVIRVTATIQYPDMQRPWMKKLPFTRAGLGTVIDGGRLLVTADTVAHSTYIELEKPEDGPKGTAVVEAIDQECNLAVLKPVDEAMLQGTHPLSLDESVRTGSTLQILQLEQNGAAALSPATVTTVAVMAYPSEGSFYLLYRASTTIPQREGSFVIPALHDGKLAGLVMRYDPKTQAADIIPAPLISRFLKESAKPGYRGLARAGLGWEPVRGATLREWLGARDQHAGVYVTWVKPGGPAEKAGLRKGDLLLKAGGHEIDGEGNYADPVYGKITFNNLASLESSPGAPLKISYFRSSGEGTGTNASTTLHLDGRNPGAEISPSLLESESPPYLLLGGLLFQELSRPYLYEWGPNWQHEAPQDLVYLDAFQDELPRDHGHFVILSTIFPTQQTIGFQDLANRVVKSINGRPIRSLADITEAAKHPEKGFQKIILEGSVGPVYLDTSTLAAEEQSVRAEYGIPSLPESNPGIQP